MMSELEAIQESMDRIRRWQADAGDRWKSMYQRQFDERAARGRRLVDRLMLEHGITYQWREPSA